MKASLSFIIIVGIIATWSLWLFGFLYPRTIQTKKYTSTGLDVYTQVWHNGSIVYSVGDFDIKSDTVAPFRLKQAALIIKKFDL
jgi:hypothetical protein